MWVQLKACSRSSASLRLFRNAEANDRLPPTPVIAWHRRIPLGGRKLSQRNEEEAFVGGQTLAGLIAPWHSACVDGVEAEGGHEDMQPYD